MLIELRIENFAIIDQITLTFNRGLTTLTGETGAGKSIIIDAVETILGGRADGTMVRSDTDLATVEGVFQITEDNGAQVKAILQREDLHEDDADHLTVSREIRVGGRNVARVNGRSVTASILKELGEHLIDVHGQSEHLSLLRVRHHLQLLDQYAISNQDATLEKDLDGYRKTYLKLNKVKELIEGLEQSERDTARRVDMLNFQINEIESAHLIIGEDEELVQERNRLSNAESLVNLIQQSLLMLDEGTPDTNSATDLLGQTVKKLENLAKLDPSKADLHSKSISLFEETNDLANGLREYLDSIEFNPKRLNQVEERLELIDNLKRKYSETITGILEFASNAEKELDNITHAEERLEELKTEREELLVQIGKQGWIVSQKRSVAADELAFAMERELDQLNMSGAQFKVSIQHKLDPDGVVIEDGRRIAYGPHGLEQVEFLIAPNPGEGFKPLVKIASGGETSRLMLAIKNVLVKADRIPTLIFDEIDQGIGGRVGTIVGEKLWVLGRSHQVLCITHLPQLAAFGDQHFNVQKQISQGRTTTNVQSLDGEERLIELAQMMGEVSEGTLHSARELAQLASDRTAALKITA